MAAWLCSPATCPTISPRWRPLRRSPALPRSKVPDAIDDAAPVRADRSRWLPGSVRRQRARLFRRDGAHYAGRRPFHVRRFPMPSMTLRPYAPTDRDGCLALFAGNVPDYFAELERADFIETLDR